jgi:alpha-ketoglutarate-dependent taurine dioxygenase
MKKSFLNQQKLPLVIEQDGCNEPRSNRETLLSLYLTHAESLHKQLLQYGALLFRGFPALSVPEFGAFARRFSGKNLLDYVGGASPRIKLGHGIYTSTEYPKQYTLSLHNELSYTHQWPEYLFFCCVTPSPQGGETPLGDSRTLLKNIDEDVARRFKSRNIRYDRNLVNQPDSELSWQAAFETCDRAMVERYCRERGVNYKWKDDGGLWLSEIRPATATHEKTGEEVWFNQADGFHPSGMGQETYQALISTMPEDEFRLNAFFGDAGPIDVLDLNHVREVMRAEMVLVPWQTGDILVIDNMLVSHGRMPYTGSRKILLAMA